MIGPDYIFCLQDKDYNFWNVKPDGSVELSANHYFLDFSPEGWDDIAIQNIRNKFYKGLDRSVTVPLGYVLDGAAILKEIAYERGLHEQVFLTIASQQLKYTPGPIGVLVGGGSLAPGVNNGTITIPTGFTGYIKITVNSANTSDQVYGYVNNGGTYVSVGGGAAATQIIPITAGTPDFSLFFFDTSSGVTTVTLVLCSEVGLQTVSYGFWYKRIFRGEVDWSTYDHAARKVTVTTLEDGLPKYLKANEKTVYEIPMDSGINVKEDGIKLHEKLNYDQIPDLEISYPLTVGTRYLVPTIFISNEGNATGVLVQSQNLVTYSGPFPDEYINGDNFIIQNTGLFPVVVNVSGYLDFTVTERTASAANITFRFLNSESTTGNQNLYRVAAAQNMVVGQRYSQPYNFNITLIPNSKLFLDAIFNITGTSASYHFNDSSKMSLSFITRYQTTYIKALRPQFVFEQLISKITEGRYTATLSAFFAAHKDKVLTCGNAIRNIDGAVMKISWYEFFKHWDSIFSVAIVERAGNKVDFGEEEQLIDLVNVIDLPEPAVDSLRITIDKELLANEIEVGSPELNNEVGMLNGKQEFNCKMLFSTAANTSPQRIDKVSGISASCMEQELIRTTNLDKKTTDYKSDNKNYTIHISNTLITGNGNDIPDHYQIDRSLNPLVTAGVIETETTYNYWFTPKRSILRFGSHLHGRFYKGDPIVWFFRNADQNKELICDGIIEKADFTVGSLKAAFAVPLVFNMQLPPPLNTLSLLEINPLQAFRFPFQGQYYKGLLNSISVVTSTHKSQQVVLRSAFSNDHSKLKKYY